MNIQSKILKKYDVDITQENILKLYKIENAEISSDELNQKIEDTRKRWNTSINGANEKNAQRDGTRLEKADQYEKILRDDEIRKEIQAFYNKSSKEQVDSKSDDSVTAFAKEYFDIIATTKKINKSDVEFFFKYYKAECKYKKAINQMLVDEKKISRFNKLDEEDGKEAPEEDGKKKESSPLIVNLFQEATIIKIRRAIEKYEEVACSDVLVQRYPKLERGLFEYLEIKNVENAQDFRNIMSSKGQEAYAVRQERGVEYVPLVDLLNLLKEIGEYQDVVDNITEFKLLLKYPSLTPYMFAFIEMKPKTMKKIVDIAKKEYSFRDETDFILNYYTHINDNFGINDSGINGLIKKAKKKTKQNEILNDINEKLGRNKNKRKIPIAVNIIHGLVYWPIFLFYFIFEVMKVIFTNLHRTALPIFVVILLFESWWIPKYKNIDNLLALRKIFFKHEWISYLENEYLSGTYENVFIVIVTSLFVIILLLMIYVLPALFVSVLIAAFADDFNKQFDWRGIERTLQQILLRLKRKTEEQYRVQQKLFFRNKISKIILNCICLLLVLIFLYFAPMGLQRLSEITGYGQALWY